jgi:hypothetical protein
VEKVGSEAREGRRSCTTERKGGRSEEAGCSTTQCEASAETTAESESECAVESGNVYRKVDPDNNNNNNIYSV